MSKEYIDLEDMEMTPLLKRVIAFSSGGPFLEGYVLSIIGVALTTIGNDIQLDSHWMGMLGVAALVGLFAGALIGGWLTDLIGRRKMFVLDLLVIIVLSLLCAVITSAWQLLVLRFLMGVTIGADYPIATSMIAEFSPKRYRAMAMGLIAAAWYLGANVAALVGFFLVDIDNGWRWMLFSSAIPCVIILLGRWSIPESPRWLASKGREAEAEKIIHETLGAHVRLPAEEKSEPTKISVLFKAGYAKRIIFIATIWLCQAIPMFALYTYGPQIIGGFGLGEGRYALLGELVIGTFFMLGTFPAMYLCERIGRRPLIIGCFLGMTISLGILGIVPAPTMVVVMICFVSYAILSGGPGNLEWLYPNELFPTSVRATAMGVAMALSRIATVISMYVLPTFIKDYGIGTTMLAGAAISLLGFLVSVAWAPETRGKTLAETGSLEFSGR
ncbi:MAG: MFS transporter [Arcanobacterium sp.]|nr:MFS transporter [Arcanobacterium sp.]